MSFREVGSGDDVFACLDLAMDEDLCDIQAKGVSIGTMNKKTHLALRKIGSREALEYIGLLPRIELVKKLAAVPKHHGPGLPILTCSMDILVLGPRSVAGTLARDLSRYRLFLQHPYPMSTPLPYENPQYFEITGCSFPNGAILPPILTGDLEQDSHPSDEVDDDEIVDLPTVMDNLPELDYLREADVDGRIGAKLLR